MINAKTIKAIEFDRILSSVAKCAVLNKTKDEINCFIPASNIVEAEFLLKKTTEAYNLLYKYNVGGIYFVDDIEDELSRVDVKGTLINGELLKIASNLRGARIVRNAILSVNDENISILPEIASRLFTNQQFEDEISSKIISEDEISDNASPNLYQIRKNIRQININIREKLNSYMHGQMGKYLQDGVVTMRQDRYVIPVKSEYRSFVKGFIHDQSSSGATVFIEPEQVLELNNKLKCAYIEEANEIHKILVDLSSKVSYMSQGLRYNTENLIDLDNAFSRAIYSFENKCSLPVLNDKGIFDIKAGRHPLIEKTKVVPIDYHFGKDYNFLLITGPNTGGKTVTLKLTGLLSMMAMSGIYIPCADDSKVSIFKNIFCDIGDEQSIEESLSTFSSHIKNIIGIVNNADNESLVLIDEIGAGTDPEEGSALALSLIETLLLKNSFGIVTTHYSKLKEFAVQSKKIENACMEFDPISYKPMYKMNIGIPGSSNAIEIAKSLGLDDSIINRAISYLDTEQVSFENVLKKAEESRRESEQKSSELEKLKDEKQKELEEIALLKEKIKIEHEKIYTKAKAETKRIVADKLSEAEEIIDELKSILKQANLESKEVFRASELKNRLKNSRYLVSEDSIAPFELVALKDNEFTVGLKVYSKNLGAYAVISNVKYGKNEVEILIGNAKTTVKKNTLYKCDVKEKAEPKVIVKKNNLGFQAQLEINVVGKNSLEALDDVKNFLDQAILYNLEEVKIIHGVGSGVLLKVIREYLKKDKNVVEFRRGKFGEGENGVTIVKLK